ncbi:TPA: type II secretion system F family protein [Bacillus cereus]
MHSILIYSCIFLIFCSVFLLVLLLSKSKGSALSQFVQANDKEKRRLELRNIKGIRMYLPQSVIQEARKYEWKLTKSMYWLYTILSGMSIAVIIYFSFGRDPFTLLTVLSGFLVPRFLLYRRKKRYYLVVIERLSIYMKAVANALQISNNAKRVLVQVKPMMHGSIQEEIEKVSLLLEGGTTIHRAFRGFNETFNFRELVFFHEMLEVCSREGGTNSVQVLLDIAEDFEKQKLYLARLRSSLAQAKRAFVQNCLIVIAMPIVIMMMSKEAYGFLAGSMMGKIALLTNMIILFFLATRVEKIANYNPTERSD